MKSSFFSTIASLFSTADEQLMWRVQMADDPEAFAELMRRWRGPVQNLAARMIGDTHRSEDVAQETFLRIYAHRRTYRAEAKFSTFLWRVALNLCHDELRKVKRRGEWSTDSVEFADVLTEMQATTPAGGELVEAQERAEEVRDALQRLAEPYRAVVVPSPFRGVEISGNRRGAGHSRGDGEIAHGRSHDATG